MAAPMRDGPLDSGHRAKVADPRTAAAAAAAKAEPATAASNNFEYDDNEWDIGIGDLIIDLDADIEKTNEKSGGGTGGGSGAAGGGATGAMASAGGGAGKGGAKMAVEHSATVDKGLKMKIKRTKPGTKTSEAKHEIVKPGEQNGGEAGAADAPGKGKHPPPASSGGGGGLSGGAGGGGSGGSSSSGSSGGGGSSSSSSKRGSSGHRRDKARDKHSEKSTSKPSSGAATGPSAPSAAVPDVNGVVRSPGPAAGAGAVAATQPSTASSGATGSAPAAAGVQLPAGAVAGAGAGAGAQSAPQQPSPAPPPPPAGAQQPGLAAANAGPTSTAQQPARVVFPVSGGPGPPAAGAANAPGPPVVPVSSAVAGAETPTKAAEVPDEGAPSSPPAPSAPPAKRLKTEPKDMLDVCVGTSVGTITEPDCLGPCEPGTSVTLEGIVWHETEGGVLVVNVTWRGKTYVGTLLDCTRHDWAPPRFCDSPTSDLDARMPKGRGKRGRAAANASPAGDLSNFTETRSSVHSKLRNGGAKGRRGGGGSGGGGAGTGAGGAGPGGGSGGSTSAGSGSPTPFVPPRPEATKRKGRASEEAESPGGKKSRTPAVASAAGSPPASPVLLECPEPNCSKKYKHINGLKYHQSHAHGSADDEDTKDAASMSENDESTAEAPSPAQQPLKSPEKVDASAPPTPTPATPTATPSPAPPAPAPVPAPAAVPLQPKKEDAAGAPAEPPSQPGTPKSGVVSPATPLSSAVPTTPTSTPAAQAPAPPPPPELAPAAAPLAVPLGALPSPEPAKSVLKPGVLRFGPTPADEYPLGVYGVPGKPAPTAPAGSAPVSTIRTLSAAGSPGQPQAAAAAQPAQAAQPTSATLPSSSASQPPQPPQVLGPQPVAQIPSANKPQFKVKPTSSLMPDDKKDRSKVAGHKKKNRKSPAGSPHPPEQPSFGMDASGREDVQSPAYSDISDDAAPVLESEVSDAKSKAQTSEKKAEVGQGPSPHTMPHYGIYPFYGQPPYLVPSVQQDGKPKEPPADKLPDNKTVEKDKKEGTPGGEYPQKLLQPHYYPYGYVPSYPYNLEPSYPMSVMPPEDKVKEPVGKDEKSPSPTENVKSVPLAPSPIQVPNPTKVKTESGVNVKDKHQNENHQILKESIEIKNQMNPYAYPRPQPSQPVPQQPPQPVQVAPQQPPQSLSQQQQQQQQQQEELRRYYLYPDQQRRKEPTNPADVIAKNSSTTAKSLASPSHKHKDKQAEEKKEDKVKQEGVKPTMETQGPPPPPTSSYAYIHHPSYMQAPHYGPLPFDPGHPMYRSMLVPGPYGANPYLHPQLPRYPHAPEDLSRPPSGPPKALDLLQHHASQYYSSHKIHELQERALKSPTPKPAAPSASPSGAPPTVPPVGTPTGSSGAPQGQSPIAGGPPPGSQPSAVGKPPSATGDNKDSRSPPPQRHVHTHHHTHVGLGYPILAGQYPAPYGAAVLASQQAAAVAATVINPYPPK